MKRIEDWQRNTALVLGCIAFALMGCSAKQTSSIPTPPEPKAEASTPSTPSASTKAPKAPDAPESPEPKPADTTGDGERETSAQGPKTETSEAAEPGAAVHAGTATTTGERRAGLDGKLDESLREFDGLILKEQELLEERREETAANGGGGGGGGGLEGVEPSDGGTGSGGGSGDDADSESQDQPAQMAGTGGSPDAAPEDSTVGPGGVLDGDPAATDDNGRVPGDVGDGRDDDIVARQLREAAMQEQDPQLRERLWEEYRTYKSGAK